MVGSYPKNWSSTQAGDNLHAIVEGCEPTTGIRFCRTYFLRQGKSLPFLIDTDALVTGGGNDGGDGDNENKDEEYWNGVDEITHPTLDKIYHKDLYENNFEDAQNRALSRLEGLYVKLWLGLRHSVRAAFQIHEDVLEAGKYVQRAMDLLMKGKATDELFHMLQEGTGGGHEEGLLDGIKGFNLLMSSDLVGVVLQAGERVQVHMDCMNGFGEVVTIEDVDDMGGSCWTYIRVSVHNVSIPSSVTVSDRKNSTNSGNVSMTSTGAVAVGDTFLFSSGKTFIAHNSPRQIPSLLTLSQRHSDLPLPSASAGMPLLSDSFCLTHAVPYYRALLGGGVEEASTQRLLACLRSTHM